jgi:hypothetical protein
VAYRVPGNNGFAFSRLRPGGSRCVPPVCFNPQCTFKYKTFRKDFVDIFGESLAVACIDDPEIEIARHCLTHNGGKPSTELKGTTYKIRVQDDRLQVFPEDVRALFSLLTDRVLKVANAAQNLQVFKLAKPNP